MGETGTYKQYAESIALFEGWTEVEIADFLPRGKMLNVAQGKVIFERGTRGNALYIVFSGVVDILAGEYLLAQCTVGHTFGTISAIDHRPHTATAIAGTDALLFALNDVQIADVLRKDYAVRFLLSVVHQLGAHISNANTHLAAMESKLARIERTRTPARRE
jgi:CRP-like cAMP-binding protein